VTFREYDELHERCELYKARALEAIKDLKCYTFEIYNLHSSLNQCSDTELSYSIEDEDGYEYGGRIPIEVLDLYMEGNVELAKTKYKEIV
jgi:hypothetical protein